MLEHTIADILDAIFTATNLKADEHLIKINERN